MEERKKEEKEEIVRIVVMREETRKRLLSLSSELQQLVNFLEDDSKFPKGTL